ncbi:MAG: YcnI family protein [Acidimicrobiales bacterium]
MIPRSRAVRRAGLAVVAAVGIGLALPVTASAHVTVRPDVETSGSFAKLTVRVPNESDTAGTVALRVELPADPPFASVSVQPHVGWTAELTRETPPEPVEVGEFTLDEIVMAVTRTADDGVRIGPGEFDEFAISVGPLPAAGDYTLAAEQTYDDGEVVTWADGPDGDLPAPVLTVVDAAGQGSDAATSDERAEAKAERKAERQAARAAADDGSERANGADRATEDTSTNDPVARALAVGGLAVGAAGVGIGTVSLRRSRG